MAAESQVNLVETTYGKEKLSLETGRLAKQADASVLVQYGGTVVLVTTVVSDKPRAGADFLPLFVEYQEKTYAAGKIPGGFFKREGRPTEKEILNARIIDRPIRPLLPEGLRNEVQIVAWVLSFDRVNDPDILAIIGASAALNLSPAPVKHLVGACRVGRVESELVLNPTYEEDKKSDLDLLICTTSDGVVMLETGAKEVAEKDVIAAMKFAQEQAQVSVKVQEALIKKMKVQKRDFPLSDPAPELIEQIQSLAGDRVGKALAARAESEGGGSDETLVADLLEKLNAGKAEDEQVTEDQLGAALDKVEQKFLRQQVLEKKKRIDGRALTDLRQITCDTEILPRTHGSGLFTRGQTQSLSCATLGTGSDEQMIDAPQGKWNKSFMLHYNFPPFSVGEVRPMRGPGRREIGHGALAEKALKGVMPDKETFPYTVRLVSEILESNGSSSMATVCAGTLALMDAGVPITAPVTGIAMGLVKEGDRHAVLTDIMGMEDHHGDMDFKVAGTEKGITALQLDLKLTGVPLEILVEAIEQAAPARAHILKKITEQIKSPRTDLSEYAPRITVIKIDPEKIGGLIGPGGKMIRRIIAESGASVDVEDDGSVLVASSDEASSQKAVEMIKGLTEDAEVGKVYDGVVKRIMNFGAFCEIAPGKEGLCHVSELSEGFVENVEDVIKIGDPIKVKVIEIDQMGRVNLSAKQAVDPDAAPVPMAARRGGGGGDNGGRDRSDRGGRDRFRDRGPRRSSSGPGSGPRSGDSAPRGPRRDFGR